MTRSLPCGRSAAADAPPLQALFDTIPDLIWLKDPQGACVACNRAFRRFFGLPQSPLPGRRDAEPTRLAAACPALERTLAAGPGPQPREVWFESAEDGRRALLQITSTAVADEGGRFLGVLGVGRDITERHRAEEALRLSEERYRQLFDNADGLISVYDRQGVCQLMNRKVAALFGGEPKEFVGKSLEELHPGRGEEYTRRVRNTIDTGHAGDYEEEVAFARGTRWLVSRVHRVPDARPGAVLAQIISQDLTEWHRAREALQSQLDELRRWHEASLGREERILALKQEVNRLLAELARAPRYAVADPGAGEACD